MTNHPDHTHTMKMLAKVARGLDLPAPQVSSPLQPAAPLPDEDNFDERWFDNAPGTSEPQVSESVVEPAAAAETGQTESVPHMPAPDGNSDDNLKPFEVSPTGSSPGSTSSKAAAGHKPDTPSETVAVSADADSDPASPATDPPAAPRVAAELNEEIAGGQTEPAQRPERMLPGKKDPGSGNPSGVPQARWVFHSAGEPKSQSPRQVSRMLRPVFEMSSRTSSAEPTVGRQTQNPISADRRPESDGPRDLAQPATQSAGTGLPPGLPDRQPAGGADNRIPSSNKKAVSHLMGTGSTVDKPLTRTNQPAVKTAAASNNRAISRLQNKDTASVRQVVPPAAAANIDRSRQAPTTVSKDVLPAKTGDVSVGKINIQVRGQRQAEDDWPAPPRYASHTITEDWEWSCHYGR